MEKKNIDKIIDEEVSNMIERLKERGIDGDRFIVSIKAQKAVPNEDSPLEVDSIDELLEKIGNRNKKKEVCPSCGKLEHLVPVIKNGNVKLCEKCKKECDKYTERIITALKNGDKESYNEAVADFLTRDFSDEEEPTLVEEFVYDCLLENIDFESKDDIIDFLAEVEEFVESENFEL